MSSKIKVDTIENVAGSGNVSLGSGHNLVVPGNITGSGTATITGDLTVDTSTLKVDSSNNRTIMGYTSGRVPTSVIVPHVNSSIAPAMRITTHGNSGYSTSNSQGAGARLEFGQYDDGYDWITGSIASTRTGSNWGGDLIFSTNNNSASNNQTEGMRINRDGYVTTPNQPMFGMYSTANSGMAAANSDIILNAGYNGGNHVNTSTGVFTVPVAGRYMFSAYAIKHNQNGVVARLRIVQNGSTVAEARMDESGNYTQACAVVILNLAANDAIKFTNGDNTQFYMGGTYGRVNGHFLG